MSLRTYTCPHCGANMMIEIGKKKAICEYCDSELYIDEIVNDIKRDWKRDDLEDEKYASRNSGSQGGTYAGGAYSGSGSQGAYSGQSYDSRTQNQNYAPNYSQSQSLDPRVSPKNRMLALLLCAFLGVFGVHRFYVGKIGTGILYFFTMGLFGFGWIWDIVMIAVGSFRDSSGRYIRNWNM